MHLQYKYEIESVAPHSLKRHHKTPSQIPSWMQFEWNLILFSTWENHFNHANWIRRMLLSLSQGCHVPPWDSQKGIYIGILDFSVPSAATSSQWLLVFAELICCGLCRCAPHLLLRMEEICSCLSLGAFTIVTMMVQRSFRVIGYKPSLCPSNITDFIMVLKHSSSLYHGSQDCNETNIVT